MNSHTRRNMGFGLGSHWFRGRRYHRCFQPDTGHMPYDKMPILIGVPAAVFGMGPAGETYMREMSNRRNCAGHQAVWR